MCVHVPKQRAFERSLLVGLILLYFVVSLNNLDVVPPVYEDEPWIASVSWKFATHGIYGSDVFAGFHGMGDHYYGFMPLNQILSAVVLRLSGLGLFQVRLMSVLYGAVTLLLTYALGARLFTPSVGLLAVVLLLFTRTMSASNYYITGIPLLDIVRIHRYDPGVPVFGLGALHSYLSARRMGKSGLYLLSGFLAAGAGLMHLYGALWLVPILFFSFYERASLKNKMAVALGFMIPWIFYGVYIARDFPDWIGQVQFHQERFQLLDPAWYMSNLINEYRRYSLAVLPFSNDSLLQVGCWFMLLAVPLSIGGLGWYAFYKKDQAALFLFVSALLLPLLFALLLRIKFRNYIFTLLPLLALTAAWGIAHLWAAARNPGVFRTILVLLLSAVIIQGFTRIAVLEDTARDTTAYGSFINQVREQLPEKARVLGLHRYWIGLNHLDYRSWLVPLYRSQDTFQPIPIETALEQVDPQLILIDPAMRRYMTNPPPGDTTAGRIMAWMDGRNYLLVADIEDRTYGKIEIYSTKAYIQNYSERMNP